MKNQTEQEKYFAAKNRRHKWWRENAPYFAVVPLTITAIVVVIGVLSIAMTQIGLHSVAVKQTLKQAIRENTEPRFQSLEENIGASLLSQHLRIDELEWRINSLTNRISTKQ